MLNIFKPFPRVRPAEPVQETVNLAPTIIAIIMEKGGVAKTTTTLNLGDALARAGKRVLIIDLDAQRSLTQWCGISLADAKHLFEAHLTVYSALLRGTDPNPMIVKRDGAASLLPGADAMAGAVDELNREPADALYKLKEMTARLAPNWDYILIDCPPALGIVTVNALVAATHCIVPVKADFISTAGLSDVLRTIRSVQGRSNRALLNLGVLPTMYSAHLKEDKAVLADLMAAMSAQNLTTLDPIPRTTQVDQSSSLGTSVVISAPRAEVSIAYTNLATHIIQTL